MKLQIQPDEDGVSMFGFKVQGQSGFGLVAVDGDLMLGSGSRTLLHISGPDTEASPSDKVSCCCC